MESHKNIHHNLLSLYKYSPIIKWLEKFREEIAQFTVHLRDFVRKMHGREFWLLPAMCHTPLIFDELINKYRQQMD